MRKSSLLGATLAFFIAIGAIQPVLATNDHNGQADRSSITAVEKSAPKSDENRLVVIGGKKFCQAPDGSPVTGWQKIDGRTYYFDPRYEGAACTSWLKLDGKWFTFASDGTMNTGWVTWSGSRYYADPEGELGKAGVLAYGWKSIDGHYYYLDPAADGKAVTGWMKLDGKWYKFSNSGQAITGLIPYGSSVCYGDPDQKGAIFEGGWKTVDGKKYYFTSNGGVAATGWVKDVSGKWRKFSDSGQVITGWIAYGDTWCYGNPEDNGALVANQWKDIAGSRYCFSSDGSAYKGWKQMGGYWYKFNDNAQLQTGWISYGKSNWCYGDKDAAGARKGALLTGMKTIAGNEYYFDSYGIMETGWLKTTNYGWMYQDRADGLVKNGWKKIGNDWYYFSNYGSYRGILDKDGKYYYLDWDTYKLARKQWVRFTGGSHAGKAAYASGDGSFLTGPSVVNGVKVKFDSKGFVDSTSMPDGCPYYLTSKTNWCITVDRSNHWVYVYRWKDGYWNRWYTWRCTTGGLKTPLGHFTTDYRSNPRPYPFGLDHGYAAFYFTHFYDGCGFHTLLYLPYDWNKLPVKPQLGTNQSQGCIRLEEKNARWIYNNIPLGTSIFIYR